MVRKCLYFPLIDVVKMPCRFSPLSNAEYLQQLVPSARVVKALNILSAYSLETGGIQGSREVR